MEPISMKNIIKFSTSFMKDEDGAALTEYLVLLGLLVGGVVAAVIAFGTQLSATWETWDDFVATLIYDPT
jgi:pilus assembly protein Flp/PilA